MSLSINTFLPGQSAPLDEPATMPIPIEPVAWRRWADAMPDICLWIDPHSGRIVDSNRALFGVLGYNRNEVFGWPLQALAEARNLETALATWRSLAACAELRDADCTMRARNGFDVAVSASANPVYNNEGKLVAGLVVLRDITDRCRREQTLLARKRQLKVLAYELAVADTRERSRSAVQLHAGVGERLVTARAKLQQLVAAAGVDASAQLAELVCLLDGAMQTARKLGADLSGPHAKSQGLQASINQLAETLTRDGPLIARVDGELPATLQIPDTTGAVLLRVLRELALNARAHANAQNLSFRIQTEPERLSIVVSDDGTGFDVVRVTSSADGEAGLGLLAAEAQMQAIGGLLVVQSKPGRGTRAIVALPLAAAEVAAASA